MVDYQEGCQAPDWDQHESDRQQTSPREYTNDTFFTTAPHLERNDKELFCGTKNCSGALFGIWINYFSHRDRIQVLLAQSHFQNNSRNNEIGNLQKCIKTKGFH